MDPSCASDFEPVVAPSRLLFAADASTPDDLSETLQMTPIVAADP